jgi:hypothetical protein
VSAKPDRAKVKVLDFARGRMVEPIPGTVCYDAAGRAVGIWGKDMPTRLMWWPEGQAEPRPMTRAEERFARRMLRL